MIAWDRYKRRRFIRRLNILDNDLSINADVYECAVRDDEYADADRLVDEGGGGRENDGDGSEAP